MTNETQTSAILVLVLPATWISGEGGCPSHNVVRKRRAGKHRAVLSPLSPGPGRSMISIQFRTCRLSISISSSDVQGSSTFVYLRLTALNTFITSAKSTPGHCPNPRSCDHAEIKMMCSSLSPPLRVIKKNDPQLAWQSVVGP
jgi:hypothetical protein